MKWALGLLLLAACEQEPECSAKSAERFLNEFQESMISAAEWVIRHEDAIEVRTQALRANAKVPRDDYKRALTAAYNERAARGREAFMPVLQTAVRLPEHIEWDDPRVDLTVQSIKSFYLEALDSIGKKRQSFFPLSPFVLEVRRNANARMATALVAWPELLFHNMTLTVDERHPARLPLQWRDDRWWIDGSAFYFLGRGPISEPILPLEIFKGFFIQTLHLSDRGLLRNPGVLGYFTTDDFTYKGFQVDEVLIGGQGWVAALTHSGGGVPSLSEIKTAEPELTEEGLRVLVDELHERDDYSWHRTARYDFVWESRQRIKLKRVVYLD